jgi:N-formylmaleamate deformylase
MFNYTEGDFQSKGIKTHYYRTGGRKPPIILLHGATDNGLCWSAVAEVLAKDFDVILLDAQGHGLSDRMDKDFSYSSHTRQVIDLVQHLGISKPIIMGHSMGAGTTANVAVQQPELPKAIILEDPGWLKEGPDSEDPKQREGFIKALLGYRQLTQDELIAECRKNNPRWSESEIVPWAKAKQQFDPDLFSKLFLRPSYEELVPRIKCPTLLITSDGGVVSEEVARHASRLWTSKELFRWVKIKGAGHNIRREQFGAFMEAVSSFLREIG